MADKHLAITFDLNGKAGGTYGKVYQAMANNLGATGRIGTGTSQRVVVADTDDALTAAIEGLIELRGLIRKRKRRNPNVDLGAVVVSISQHLP